MTQTWIRRPLTKLVAFAVGLGVVFGAAYALGAAVPDTLDDGPPPGQVHEATVGAHP